jgi:Xaa-Pro aminopeptidase
MRPGASSMDVFKATLAYVEQRQNELKTTMAKEAAADALKRKGYALHGLGVDMAEGAPKAFQAGNVLCYEPQLTSGNQAFFVEDTFLITAVGHEIINPALPYSPSDIEKAMSQSWPQVK